MRGKLSSIVQVRAKKVPAKFSGECSVWTDGPCIGSLDQWAEVRRENSNIQELFCMTLNTFQLFVLKYVSLIPRRAFQSWGLDPETYFDPSEDNTPNPPGPKSRKSAEFQQQLTMRMSLDDQGY